MRIASAVCAAVVLTACDKPAASRPTTTPAATTPTPTGSAGDHVVFFVIGKSWHHQQDATGKITLTDMGYFAEIFKTIDGQVSQAAMQLKAEGSEPIPFVREADGGAVLHGRAGKRHQDLAALDAELPNGDYVFSFTTPAGAVADYEVTLSGEGGKTDLPAAPKITLTQGSQPARSDAVAPDQDVVVRWTAFEAGRADPNGISDDLIFVMMADCHGERAFHSGRPLGTANPLEPDRESATLLTFKDTEATIPASALTPGMTYRLDVEHARLLDTDKRHGVVGMSTFAVTTHLDVKVEGELEGEACPVKSPRPG